MKIFPTLLALLILSACNATTPKKQQKPFIPLSASEAAEVNRVASVGRELYERDIRAAEASDLLLARIYPGDYPNFVGWVTYPNDEDYTVSFYEKDGDKITIIGDVVYDAEQIPDIQIKPKRAPNVTEISMLKARLAALEKGTSTCSERFNTVVVPGATDKEWDVFVLAATTDPRAVQVGGHTKVGVSKADATVTKIVPLSKSCLALNKSPDDLPEGTSVKMLTVSHIVSNYPAEIHPYLNLLHDIAFAVITERGIWMVEEGDIRIVAPKSGDR